MRIARLALIALCLSLPLLAQQNPLDPGQQQVPVPVVTFELNWRQADPQWYRISVASTGDASYESQPRTEGTETGDPFMLKFIASEPTRTKIFQLARQLDYFKGKFETKHNVAQTGTKTLTYRDYKFDNRTTLNYSDNPQMNDLINLFQRISTTFEASRRLDYDLRFDHLGLDRDLKNLEELDQRNLLAELQVISPTLESIANNQSVMNIARQRARRLLSRANTMASSR